MRRLAVIGLVGLGLVHLAGCDTSDAVNGGELPRAGLKPLLETRTPTARDSSGPATMEQAAIIRVLEAYRDEFKAACAEFNAETQPTQYAQAFKQFVTALEKQNTKDASLEFRAAWDRHLSTLRKFHESAAAIPDGVLPGVEFMEAAQAIFTNTGSDKSKRLGADVQSAARQVVGTLHKLYDAGNAAGVVTR